VAGAKGALRPSNHAQGHLKTVWFWHDLNPWFSGYESGTGILLSGEKQFGVRWLAQTHLFNNSA
jgi:hypothetical protein